MSFPEVTPQENFQKQFLSSKILILLAARKEFLKIILKTKVSKDSKGPPPNCIQCTHFNAD